VVHLRDLQAEQKFNVILVTHDLRESVFLADTVYVMSKSPGRFVVRREIDLPRPRDLEVTYTPSSRTSCTSCAATSAPCARAAPKPLQPFLNKAHHETSKNRRALGSLAAVAADRPALADHLLGLRRLGIHLPQPLGHGHQLYEFAGTIAMHAWRTYWVTMAGFALAIVVGVLLGFLIGSSRLAYAAFYPLMTAFNALPKAAFVPILVVWFGIGAGPAILTAF
jgi:hypothetical protein